MAILYKYLNIAAAKSMIENHNLRFTHASNLNDIDDCRPELLDYSNVPKHQLQGWIPAEFLKKKRELDACKLYNNTWICSLSKTNDSMLLWAHYGQGHKGVCIGLNIDKIEKTCSPFTCGVSYLSLHRIEVQYKNITERPNGNCGEDAFSFYQLETKDKKWDYEQEVRLVMNRCNDEAPYQDATLKPECFDSIYFGAKMDKQNQEELSQLVRKNLGSYINIYYMDYDLFKLKALRVQ